MQEHRRQLCLALALIVVFIMLTLFLILPNLEKLWTNTTVVHGASNYVVSFSVAITQVCTHWAENPLDRKLFFLIGDKGSFYAER